VVGCWCCSWCGSGREWLLSDLGEFSRRRRVEERHGHVANAAADDDRWGSPDDPLGNRAPSASLDDAVVIGTVAAAADLDRWTDGAPTAKDDRGRYRLRRTLPRVEAVVGQS
jgi:hypothetical protein